jgi:hypothetical protein
MLHPTILSTGRSILVKDRTIAKSQIILTQSPLIGHAKNIRVALL